MIPFYLLIAAIAGLGLGFWLSTIAVRYRDVRNLADYGLQVLKFLTPVVYSAVLIPEQWLLVFRLNPIFWVVEGFRWVFLDTGTAPNIMLAVPILLSIIVLISGLFVFRRTERTIVDWL